MNLRAFVRGALVAALAVPALAVPAVASTDTSLVLKGYGWGHGRGLGQWGAYGYAVDRGWTAAQILDHFYGGTVHATRGNDVLGVRLTALDGASSIRITSSHPFTVAGRVIQAQESARLVRNGSGWRLWVTTGGCEGPDKAGVVDLPSSVVVDTAYAGDDVNQMLGVCNTGRLYRDDLRLLVDGGATRLVNTVRIEQYLRGVVPREAPASWGDAGGGRGMQALMAQAAAARSYALSESRYPYAGTCDTTSCQVYGGAGRNGTSLEDARTTKAVQATAGWVRERSGRVVRTEFSSSTGGWTAGGDFAAVQDLGDSRSPYHAWTVTLSGSSIQARYPTIGTFQRLRVVSRNGLGADGGRVLTADVVGSAGSVRVTGNQFRSAMNLRSDWFTPVSGTQLLWLVRQSATPGQADAVFGYGSPDDVALACDVDGNGRDDVVAYRAGWWSIRTQVGPGPASLSFSYGDPTMRAVCGDWNGDGKDGIGVYDANGWFWLREVAGPGSPDRRFQYGWSGAAPVIGDWDGDGADGVGVVDPSRAEWYLRQTATPGAAQLRYQYGWAGVQPVVGDWDGDGRDGTGIYASGQWWLRTTASAGAPERRFTYGDAEYGPVVGDWDAAGGDGVGAVRVD